MGTLRLFFCVELEEGLKARLDRITQRLKRLPVRASWVRAENLHVTLKFLGEVDEALVPRLRAAAEAALSSAEIDGELVWRLDRLGAFPDAERPRVVWVGSTREPETLRRLVRALERALEPLGFMPEPEGRFVTHVTLGRVKDRPPSPGLRALSRALKEAEAEGFAHEARVRALTLMRSELTPQGAIYTPVFRLPFPKREQEREQEQKQEEEG